jgi:hemerythrin
MALIDWDSNLSVNVKAIDDQHKNLIKILNELHSAMLKGLSKQILGDTLNKLIEYTAYHFDMEEKLMQKYGYKDFFIHKKEHTDFVEKALKFNEDFKKGNSFLSADILTFLSDWIKNHIKGTDKKYSKLFNDNGEL